MSPASASWPALASMSRSHLSRTFHAEVGVSLRDYVRELRLDRARALLITTRLSLTEIAVECGFYDLPHFSRIFQHYQGMSPHQYRLRRGSQ